ncbi:RNA polymerase sigma factor [Parvibium lacunae]|uniref:RNA polymerase sigma factor n=1 Tax=Parvibium lacunae TaxID=1888893 RepID=A0A368L6R6_9BURK|nr:RNA polymerase sigma factor [Parvibium lacunae]RCS59343.1 RNA polymerase sigma factor [Parvibium lacunae]
MATSQELGQFLEEIERRAYKTALYAVRQEEHALDIVQDSMIKLAESYGDRPVPELAPLFQRILHNTINDFFRRQKVRNLWTTLFSSLQTQAEYEEGIDPLENIAAENAAEQSPPAELSRQQTLSIIEQELKKLPPRQREAFIMRYWEEMDVAETAAAMGCSEGSVKTHCSRATHALAKTLAARGVKL